MNRPRPLSPHLQIYKPQITSVLSIMHRITGVSLSIGSIILVAWVVALASGLESYSDFINITNHWFSHLILFGFTFALYYHLSNGIRHLFWDAGFGFELKSVYLSGLLVVVSDFIMTMATWSFIYFLRI